MFVVVDSFLFAVEQATPMYPGGPPPPTHAAPAPSTQHGDPLGRLSKRASFACSIGFGGQLVVVRGSRVEIHRMSKLLQHTDDMESIVAFDGPLKAGTSVAKVTEKCTSRAEAANDHNTALLWRIVGALAKARGVPGSEVANVLGERGCQGFKGTPLNSSVSPAARASALGEIEWLLVSGKKEEAVRSAVKAGVWDHALLLASHMSDDGAMMRHVCSSFVQQGAASGSSLAVLYSLYGGLPEQAIQSRYTSGCLNAHFGGGISACLFWAVCLIVSFCLYLQC